MLSMSKTSNISYFNYLFNNYTLCCQTDIVRLIHTTSSDHCSYNGNHFILDIIQCNHRLLSSFYKPLIILCNLWTVRTEANAACVRSDLSILLAIKPTRGSVCTLVPESRPKGAIP